MRLRNSELCRRQPTVVIPRNVVEIVVAIAASAVMALMAIGGGIAMEPETGVEDVSSDGSGHSPPPLPWHEPT